MRRTPTLTMRQGVLDRGRVVRDHNDRVLSTSLLGGGKAMREESGVIILGSIKPNFQQRYAVYSGGVFARPLLRVLTRTASMFWWR